MRGRAARALFATGAAALIGTAALAAEPGLTVTDGWLRVIIAGRPAAGYFTVRNDGATPRVLNGARSPACGSLMLHRSTEAGGQERMEMVATATVPAHGTLRFTPGDYHLMCMQPTAAVRPGAKVPVTLTFADGGTVSGNFMVRGAKGQ
ncbi:copper chaperone PCu(A)C [Acidisphaera rubrifaciens]|uniref:copper chaperone PCu(A)C n=1 Tax=Acidisphaera rubrifaciens TaxID=50715 RepID=UPI00130E2FA1|nr:copper chaperone PCu(A)C [Acidisphaera rubrifaciens]